MASKAIEDLCEAAYRKYLRSLEWEIGGTTDSQSDARRGQVVDNKGEVKVIEGDCAND